MNKLMLLNNMGFKISWKLINIGLYGSDEIPAVLTRDDVLEYLDSLLTDINEKIDNIIALMCERDDYAAFDRLLKKYADEDNSNVTIQKRKWRACLLKILIDNISKDCLQGLLELMEFWVLMGLPDDCPHAFPSENKETQGYFTQSTYDFLVGENCNWLNKEISDIVNLENNIGQGTVSVKTGSRK